MKKDMGNRDLMDGLCAFDTEKFINNEGLTLLDFFKGIKAVGDLYS